MSKQADFRLPAGFSNVPKSSTVDYFQRQWESCKSKRESDKGDEAKMTVNQCKCKSGQPGLFVPTKKDGVYCDWCGRNPFIENEVSRATGRGYREAQMRSFSGGATRSSQEGKPEFAGFLSPIVLRRFGEYMVKHQKQEDGTLRASDNWKSGFPRRVYIESLFRHFVDVWEEVTQDLIKANEGGTCDRAKLEEALCAMFFNVQGLLREVILGRDVGDSEEDEKCSCRIEMTEPEGFTRIFSKSCLVKGHAEVAEGES